MKSVPSRYRGEIIRQGILYSVTISFLVVMLLHPLAGGVLAALGLLACFHPNADSWVAPCALLGMLYAVMPVTRESAWEVKELLPPVLTGLAAGCVLNFASRRPSEVQHID